MQFVIPGCRETPPVRANGQTFHLTYAALADGELNHGYLLDTARDWATTRHGLREYVVAKETHPQPADPTLDKHFHLYIKFGRKVNISDRFHSTLFDLRGTDQRVLHPEIQSVLPTPSDRERVINYDLKDGDYIAELETPLACDRRRDAAEAAAREEAAAERDGEDGEGGEGGALVAAEKTPAWARMLNRASSVREGMSLLSEKVPHIYYLHGSRIKPMLAERVGVREPKLFTLADFNRPALDLDEPLARHDDKPQGPRALHARAVDEGGREHRHVHELCGGRGGASARIGVRGPRRASGTRGDHASRSRVGRPMSRTHGARRRAGRRSPAGAARAIRRRR